MATHDQANNIHDPDSGIGFDMRNAQLYNDSDDEEENIDARHRPRPYNHKTDTQCNCSYILLILLILAIGSLIGYSLGSAFSAAPKQNEFAPITNAPTKLHKNTPFPTRKDPFHNRNKKHKSIIDIFAEEPTPKPVIKNAENTENSENHKAFEPSAVDTNTAFEPSAIIEPSTDTSQSQSFDINSVKKVLNSEKYDLDLSDKPLKMDSEYDLGDAVIFTKIVIDGLELKNVFENAHKFNIKYPFKSDTYAANQYRQWCFHFYLWDYDSAQIEVAFTQFSLERGFDRLLIRHFNQSFTDPPIVYSGRGSFDSDTQKWLLPQSVTYHLHKSEFKSVCVEIETDDSVELSGVDLSVSVRYDDCQWSEWSECAIVDESQKHWDRGPFYDGLCGIGVQHKQRRHKESDNDAPLLNNFDAFVDCDVSDQSAIDGPEYCLKAPCESVDNFNNPNGIPSNIRYGWANHTTFYNGVGTLDAVLPDLIRIYTAHPSLQNTHFKQAKDVKQYLLSHKTYQSGYPLYGLNDRNTFDFEQILAELRKKKAQILSEHISEKVLELPVLPIKYISQTMEWLGARLTHSLLIGRVFTMAFTGSSNTAGHDNQFASTFPMQLQARLRELWLRVGSDGAGLNIRNVAVGGPPKTSTMAWHIHARSSETVSYPFNDENMNDGFWRNEDVIFWESFMNDGGRPPGIATEVQLRLTALLNGIWGGMNSIESVTADKCNAAKDLKFEQLRPPSHLGRDHLFESWTDTYGEYMGLIEMDFGTFVSAVCSHDKYQTLKINWHPNANGHRCEADIYAYLLLSAVIRFMEDNKNDILSKNKNVKDLDAFLVEKSGNWAQKYRESIATQNKDLFPFPKYCQFFCDKTIAHFALKSSEPNDWDTGFRIKDYIVYDYSKMDENTTFGNDMLSDVDLEMIADRNDRFSVEKMLRFNGWTYYQNDRDPPHFPQDRTGKIGSMDRKPSIEIYEKVWIERYKAFLETHSKNENEIEMLKKINDRNKEDKMKARQIFGQYCEEWGKYILENNYDLKVAFLIPEIGNHSLLMFVGEGSQNFYETDGGSQVIGINLETMDGSNKIKNIKYKKDGKYAYDFRKRLTQQRECYTYPGQNGCVFHNIAPGKYIMRFYPMNMTDSDAKNNGLLQIIAF